MFDKGMQALHSSIKKWTIIWWILYIGAINAFVTFDKLSMFYSVLFVQWMILSCLNIGMFSIIFFYHRQYYGILGLCVSKLTIIGSDSSLSSGQRQAIIWTNVEILIIGPLGTNVNEILMEIHTFSFKKMYLKFLSEKYRPFCFGLNVLKWDWTAYLSPNSLWSGGCFHIEMLSYQ